MKIKVIKIGNRKIYRKVKTWEEKFDTFVAIFGTITTAIFIGLLFV